MPTTRPKLDMSPAARRERRDANKRKRHKSPRYNAFHAALLINRISQEEWAAQHGVSGSHVAQVARGDRPSATLLAKIDEFIASTPQPAALL